jgi:hypothetical protein
MDQSLFGIKSLGGKTAAALPVGKPTVPDLPQTWSEVGRTSKFAVPVGGLGGAAGQD